VKLPGRLVLLGHPVSHSLSPRLQQAALRAASIALEYEAVDVATEALDETVRVLIAVRAAGNVTIPHKEAMYAACHSRSPIAERVGAVNTFWIENDQLLGDNTDVGGFDAAIRAAFDAPKPDTRLAVLGAGGAAAAVLAAAERWAGASAVIASRSRERAAALAGRFTRMARVAATYEAAVRDADLVVNATPLGLKGEDGPVDPASLRPGTRVFDLVYRRGLTPWVIRARARGLAAEDGLGMLVEQGALAFTRWFGIEPDRRAMWDAVSS
jgi:shikimate dehydrogenase